MNCKTFILDNLQPNQTGWLSVAFLYRGSCSIPGQENGYLLQMLWAFAN